MVREKSGNLKEKEESQGKSENLTGFPVVKVLPFLRFNFMISVYAKILCQEVMENFLRSGRSQEKVRENESRQKWPATLYSLHRYMRPVPCRTYVLLG